MKVFGILRTLESIEPVNYYRTYLPLVAMSNNGIEVSMLDRLIAGKHLTGEIKDMDTKDFDIYTTCRMYTGDHKAVLKVIHDWGGLYVFDSDDDLTEDYRLVGGRGRHFKRVLADADYVTVSTPELAARFDSLTQNPPVVLENYIDAHPFSVAACSAKRIYAGITVGFSGTKTHWGDWYIPAVPWKRIINTLPQVTGLVHGNSLPGYLSWAEPQAIPRCPYAEYPTALAQFDILLCAVDLDDEFNVGKSAIKAIEAMAAGVVPLCSPLPSYIRLAEAGAPVIIVENTRSAWYDAMFDLIMDPERLKNLKQLCAPWVRDNKDIKVGYVHWVNAYTQMLEERDTVLRRGKSDEG